MQTKQLEQESQLDLGTTNMDSACSSCPKWVRKASGEAIETFGANVKTRLQDHHRWIQQVRFTNHGSEKKALNQSKESEQAWVAHRKSNKQDNTTQRIAVQNNTQQSNANQRNTKQRNARQSKAKQNNAKRWKHDAKQCKTKQDKAKQQGTAKQCKAEQSK